MYYYHLKYKNQQIVSTLIILDFKGQKWIALQFFAICPYLLQLQQGELIALKFFLNNTSSRSMHIISKSSSWFVSPSNAMNFYRFIFTIVVNSVHLALAVCGILVKKPISPKQSRCFSVAIQVSRLLEAYSSTAE